MKVGYENFHNQTYQLLSYNTMFCVTKLHICIYTYSSLSSLVTSASRGDVCTRVCLSVGRITQSLWMDLDDTIMNNSLGDKEQLIRFW